MNFVFRKKFCRKQTKHVENSNFQYFHEKILREKNVNVWTELYSYYVQVFKAH